MPRARSFSSSFFATTVDVAIAVPQATRIFFIGPSLPHRPAKVAVRSGEDAGGQAMSEAIPRRRIKQMEVMVADAVTETPDTTTLVLFTGNDRLEYKAGHFL